MRVYDIREWDGIKKVIRNNSVLYITNKLMKSTENKEVDLTTETVSFLKRISHGLGSSYEPCSLTNRIKQTHRYCFIDFMY